MNRAKFFESVKKSLFGGRLTQNQVVGIDALLDAFDVAGVNDDDFIVYMLATAFHETNATMQPIREIGGKAYFMRMYDVSGSRPKMARDNGNVNVGDGAKFYGRGYVQLTWFANYLRAGRAIGLDLVNNPDLALNADVAAKIMIAGMANGWFTGRKLSDYKTAGGFDYINARRIINGSDRAQLVAGYARKVLAAIRYAKVEV